MTDEERIKSILSETEHGYISFDNLHGDEAQGLKLIDAALKKQIRMKPVIEKRVLDDIDCIECVDTCCPVCKEYLDTFYMPGYCPECGQAINWKNWRTSYEAYRC